jgi:hypothetical protein
MEHWWISDKTTTNVKRNCDECWTELRWTLDKIDWNGMERTTLQSNLHPWALQQWHAKKKIIYFSFTSCFFYSFLLLPKLLQGLLITWLQAQKHIGVHNPDVNLKTHVQGKQVYVKLHHMVQILYYNQTLCVCVCVCVRVPKI